MLNISLEMGVIAQVEFTLPVSFQGKMKVFFYPCVQLRWGVNMLILLHAKGNQTTVWVLTYGLEKHTLHIVCAISKLQKLYLQTYLDSWL